MKQIITVPHMKRYGLVLLISVIGSAAVACNIPVFRYALERWKPDVSQVLILHTGEMTGNDAKLAGELQSLTGNTADAANIDVRLVDLSAPVTEDLLPLVKRIPIERLRDNPYVVVRTPLQQRRQHTIWEGALSEVKQSPLLTSPARQQLTARLLAGDAVVWLMVAAPNSERSANVRTMLQSQFDELSSSIALPEGIGEPGSELYSDIPLLLQFSVIEVDPTNPAERVLLNLLTAASGAAFHSDEDILVVPVFGRGRALEVIPATDLSPELIRDLTRFLCGACSCQVKELNPGFDLLLQHDWDSSLFGEGTSAPPPAAGGSGKNSGTPVLVPIPSGRQSRQK
jgi:hypothetical protein